MLEVQFETVFFTGHVQGVGFRYQTLQVAKEFEVCGYVGNLPDGRVQLQVEGRAAELSAFVAAVEARLQGYIRKTERSGSTRPPQFEGFSIR